MYRGSAPIVECSSKAASAQTIKYLISIHPMFERSICLKCRKHNPLEPQHTLCAAKVMPYQDGVSRGVQANVGHMP